MADSPLAPAFAPGRRRFGDAYIDLRVRSGSRPFGVGPDEMTATRFAYGEIAEAIRIVLGAPTPAPAPSLGGSADAVLVGEASYDRLGGSVSAAGDVNGDGFGDFILGAAGNGEGGYNAGAAYVIFGKADGVGPLDLAVLEPADGFKILGDAAYDRAGLSVAAAGDVNGDGFSDILVGAPGNDTGAANAGAAYLIFGRQSDIHDLDLAALAADEGAGIHGTAASDYAGYSVSSAGDVDGDGFDDFVIGAYGRNSYQGVLYLLFGGPQGIGPIDLAAIDPADGIAIAGGAAGARTGVRVAAAGDVNGDGFGDIAVGADGHDGGGADAGLVYVIFGRGTGFGTVDLADLDPADGFSIQGEAAGDRLGLQVAAAGDVNADGYGDLILGAFTDSNGQDAGAVYLIFGKQAGFGPVDLAGLDAGDGVRIAGGAAGDAVGIGAAGAGDVNGDGFDDLLVGAFLADGGGVDSGAAYVVFGRATGLAGVDFANIAAADGFRLDGGSDYDHAGASVAAAGDLDGDGFGDLLVGAPDDGTTGSNAGAAYVVFGAPTAGGPPPGPPAVDLNGAAAGRDFAGAYFENGAGAAIGSAIIVTAPGGPIAHIAIVIVDAAPGDTLSIGGTLPAAIAAAGGGALLTLTGPASASDWETALALVRFSSSSDDPTAGGSRTERIVTVLVDDGNNESEAAATLMISPVNDAPVAVDDDLAAQQDADAAYAGAELLGNDIDPDGPPLFVAAVQNPVNGGVLISAGMVVFSPAPGFSGVASFDYVVSDGTFTDIGRATVIVAPTPNRPPQLAGPIGDQSSPEDAAISFQIPAGAFLDPDGDTLLYSASIADDRPLPGWLGFDADTRTFSGTPPEHFNGTISLKATVSDGAESASDIFDLVIEPVNDAPLAQNDDYATAEDMTLFIAVGIGVLGNDLDVDSATLSARLVAAPTHGTLTLDADGSFSYAPDPDFHGTDSFTYRADDGATVSEIATAIIVVAPANDAPVAADDGYTTGEDAPLLVAAPAGLLANDADADGDPLAAVLLGGPAYGTLTLDADGGFSYAPDPDFHGTDSFTYRANDGTENGSAATVSLTVTPVNDPPSGADATIVIDEDVARPLVRADFGFSDLAEGDGFAGVVVSALPADGALLLDGAPVTLAGTFVTDVQLAAGLFIFRPDGDENGAPYATLGFRVRDSGGADLGGQDIDPTDNVITFSVEAVNDGPDNSVPGGQILDEDGILIFGTGTGNAISVADRDAADGEISVTLAIADGALALAQTNGLSVTGNGGTTVILTGALAAINAALDGLAYAPPANANGSRTLSVTTTDAGHNGAGGAMVDSDTVDIMVAPVDDAPVAQPDAVATDEASVLDGSLFGNDFDIDGPALGVAAVNGMAGNVGSQIPLPSGALLAVSSSGDFTYDPNGRFNALPGPASGAANLTGTDSFTYTLANGNEAAVTVTISGVDSDGDVLLGTPGADSLDGGVGADQVAGLDGADTLSGGPGADVMTGGPGHDRYIFDSADDVAAEASGEGTDIIYSAVGYALNDASEVESLSTITWERTDPLDLVGNALANHLIGNAGPNRLDGGAGNDVLIGREGDDVYIVDGAGDRIIEAAGGGSDTIRSPISYRLNDQAEVESLSTIAGDSTDAIDLFGNALDNRLIGNAGANQLDGGGGGDLMAGLGGDDTYLVDRAADQALEEAGAGYDAIYSAVSFTLSDASEVEGLSTITWERTDLIDLTGNGLNNYLIGNAGANRLDGAGGNDVMYGREGDDSYIVDSAGDRVFEFAGQGADIIYSAVSYTLAANTDVESLATISFEATNSINLTGNGLHNTLIGNAGNNQLDGKAGADTMIGREGNDTYLVDNAGDKAFEGAGGGYDVIYSAVSFALTDDQEAEGLSTITWEMTDAIDLTGNGLNNYLIGNAGVNVLDGKAGNDTLQGREGADTFAFTTALGASNVDRILDFSSAEDTIALENEGVFVGLAGGALPSDAFVIGTAAQEAHDRIVYNQATGQLFFDADGSGAGAAVRFATLQGAPVIAANDFMVI